jgi:hypothetical protein
MEQLETRRLGSDLLALTDDELEAKFVALLEELQIADVTLPADWRSSYATDPVRLVEGLRSQIEELMH